MKVEYSELIEKIQSPKLKQIIIDALGYNDKLFKKIRKTIPNALKIKGYTSISKITFRNYRLLVNPILDLKIFSSEDTSKLLLEGFYLKREKQCKIIYNELKKNDYKPTKPDFQENFCELNSLLNKDIFSTDDASYFRPNGKKINEVNEEDASILAALLGWIVIDEESLKEISINKDVFDENENSSDEGKNIESEESIKENIKDINEDSSKNKNSTEIKEKEELIEEKLDINDDKKGHNIEIENQVANNDEIKNEDFEQSIINLQSDFLKSSQVFLQVSEDLKKEIIPDKYLEYKEIKSLKENIEHLKEKFGLPEDKKYNSPKDLKEAYKNLQKNKDQEIFDKILIVLDKYKKIYHIKGKTLSSTQVLNDLANKYENSIIANNVKKDEDWYMKLINGSHLYNFLINSIEHQIKDEYDELDESLDKLEIECKEYKFDFYKMLSREINRGNLAFERDNTPPPTDENNTNKEDVEQEEDPIEIRKQEQIEPFDKKSNQSHEKDFVKEDTENKNKIVIEGNNKKVSDKNSDIIIEEQENVSTEDLNEAIVNKQDLTSEEADQQLENNQDDIVEKADPQERIDLNITEQIENEDEEIPIKIPEVEETEEEIDLQEEPLTIEDENILNLLKRDEPEVAYHLALCYENKNIKLLVPSYLLQNLFLSLNIRSAEAPVAKKILENLEKYDFEFDNSEKLQFRNQLIFASVLRPSLFAYSFGSGIILSEMHSGKMNEFSKLKSLIIEFMDKSGGILNFERLIQLANEADITKLKTNFRKKVELWLSKAQTLKYRNKPRHKFSIAFNNWTKDSGWINKKLTKYCESDNVKTIRSLSNDLEDSNWKKLFEKELKEIIGKNKYRTGDAESDQWFVNQIDGLKELISEGLEYYSDNGDNLEEYDRDKKELLKFANNVIKEISNTKRLIFEDKNKNHLTDISAIYLNKVFDNVTSVMSAKEPVGKPLELFKIVNKSLLKLNYYNSGYDWFPKKHDTLLKENILSFIKKSVLAIKKIAINHHNSGNLEAFNRLITVFDITDIELVDDGEFNEKAEYEIRTLKTEIERGSAYGYILDNERSSLISSLEEIEQQYKIGDDGINYPLTHYQLSTLLKKIEAKKKVKKKELKNLIPNDLTQKKRDILLKYLKKDNLLVFNEVIEAIKSGEFIQPEEREELFKDFFQNFLEKATNRDLKRLETAITKRKSHSGINYSSLSPVQSKEAIDLIKRWKTIKATGAIGESENLSYILEIFGFNSLSHDVLTRNKNSVFFDFSCDIIKGRSRTPIPQFGSVAQGKYRLICLKENLNEEDIIEEIKDLSPVTNRAIIVFYLGWLNQQNRIELSKLSKRSKLSFLMLDEAILFYMLSINKSKFPLFVKLAAPISFAEPYQTASSNLPEEMFYGRGPQKEKLKNIRGDFSSIIYGGRQLGKTVLQREVQRIFHNPEKNNFAIYVDLRDSGIGLWNPIEKISDVLLENLKIIPNLLPDKLPSNAKLKFLINSVKEYLDDRVESRIILFLDEADKFLEKDAAKDWPHILPLKGLMENTEKRFKVIFSGLHDVRRTIKIPNNPLAHLGNPICVGSMLEKEEAIDAQLLVRTPLEALGYEFKGDDLIFTILSHCNWYPSLIQIFCSQLLNLLNDKRVVKELPVLIEEKDVTSAYNKSRKQIKEKFYLTLSLDERYDLLANIIALESIENPSVQTNGLSVDKITEMAIMAWSIGFDSTNPKMEIINLLEEMTDLGILRIESYGKFAIRTPNLIGLIGTEKQIMDNIYYKKRSLPLEFKREVSRIIYTKENRELRSPFPAVYYDKILDPENKVIVFKGSKMGGITYIHEFLLSKKREIQVFTPLNEVIVNNGIRDYWESVENKRGSNKEKVILFTDEISYSFDDILFINEKIKNRKSFSAIFIMNPNKIWNLNLKDDKAFIKIGNHNIQIINIPQWKQEISKEWFKGFCPNAEVSEVSDKIGYWHYLLEKFQEITFKTPELWKEKLENISQSELLNNQNVLNDFGVINQKIKKTLDDLVIWNGDLTKQDFIDEFSDDNISGENLLDFLISLSLIDNERKVNPIIKKILQYE